MLSVDWFYQDWKYQEHKEVSSWRSIITAFGYGLCISASICSIIISTIQHINKSIPMYTYIVLFSEVEKKHFVI